MNRTRLGFKALAAVITASMALTFALAKAPVRADDSYSDSTYAAVADYYDSASAFLSMHYNELPADVYVALDTARSNAYYALESKYGLDQALSGLRIQLEVAEATLAGIPSDTSRAPDYVSGTAAYNSTNALPLSQATADSVATIYSTNRNLPGQMIRVLVVNNFVDRLYMSIFGRAATNQEKAVWVNGIISGQYTANDIINSMLSSAEFTSRNLSTEQYVSVLYRTFLDRDPDPAGLANWANAINSGASTRQQIADTFSALDQWHSICAYYGINA